MLVEPQVLLGGLGQAAILRILACVHQDLP
jgi:hypothetical protein